jgi:DNA-binding transcriptional MerR regulator
MRISQLARAAGVRAKTIRFYESVAIVPEASRRPNG